MDSKIQSPGMSEMLKIAIVIFLLHHCLTGRRCKVLGFRIAPGSLASLRLLLHLGKGLGQLCIFPVGVKAFKGALG